VAATPAGAAANGGGASTARGFLPLAAPAPGYYALQVVASEDQGKSVAASQWIDFEIVP
jgi:hypothetical protein